MPTKAPWDNPEFIEKTNRTLGLEGDPDDFVRLSGERFGRIARRIAELKLIDPETLSEEGAREAFRDARRSAELLISDRLARRPWWKRVLRLG